MGWRKAPEPETTDNEHPRAPDYVEPLTAWRLWAVEEVVDAPRLRSLYRPCFWPAGVALEARCHAYRLRLRRRSRHAAPMESCTCGIYAVPFEHVVNLALDGGEPPLRALVIGTVSLWGDVVECQRGWRAEFAYPSRLFVPRLYGDAEETATGLAAYGVPVDFLDARTLAAAVEVLGEIRV